MASTLIIFLLFLLQFIYIPFISLGFEPPKAIIAELSIELIFLAVLLKGNFLSALKNLNKPLMFFLVTLWILSTVNFMLHPYELNFFGNSFRLQGILIFWHLLLFCAIASKTSLKYPNWLIFGALL